MSRSLSAFYPISQCTPASIIEYLRFLSSVLTVGRDLMATGGKCVICRWPPIMYTVPKTPGAGGLKGEDWRPSLSGTAVCAYGITFFYASGREFAPLTQDIPRACPYARRRNGARKYKIPCKFPAMQGIPDPRPVRARLRRAPFQCLRTEIAMENRGSLLTPSAHL